MGVKINRNSKITMRFKDEIKAGLAAKKKQRPKSQGFSSGQSLAIEVAEKKERRKSVPARLIEEIKTKKAEEERRKVERAKILEELIKLQEALDKAEDEVESYFKRAQTLILSLHELIENSTVTNKKELLDRTNDMSYECDEIKSRKDQLFGNSSMPSTSIKSKSMLEASIFLLEGTGDKEGFYLNSAAAIEAIKSAISQVSLNLKMIKDNFAKITRIEKEIKQKIEAAEQAPVKGGIKDISKKIDLFSLHLSDMFKKKGQDWKKWQSTLVFYASTKPENIQYDLGIRRLAGKAANAVKRVATGASKKADPSLKLLQETVYKVGIQFNEQAKLYADAMKYVSPAQSIKMADFFDGKSEKNLGDFLNAWSGANNSFCSSTVESLFPLEKFMERLKGARGSKKFKNSAEAEKELKSILKPIDKAAEKLKKNVGHVVPLLKI